MDDRDAAPRSPAGARVVSATAGAVRGFSWRALGPRSDREVGTVDGPDRERIVSALSKIAGVRGVDVVDKDRPHPRTGDPAREPAVAADVLRLYAGGGALLRREPKDLDRWSTQGGAELEIPIALAIRPSLAVDAQNRQETDWKTEVSARAGFELENLELAGRKLFLFLEYCDGRSPNGQFFERKIEYMAFGGHLFF